MPISKNQIRKNAVAFSKKWENEKRERAEKDSFYNDFFGVFGMDRKRVASFEEPVKNLKGNTGFIDLFWKGKLIVEHKSKGENLTKAYTQALDYFHGLKDRELPDYILVSDFDRFCLHDLETKTEVEFFIKDLHQHIHHFDFIAGYHQHKIREQDPVNIKAAQLIGQLHGKLEAYGFDGHQLEIYLVRIVFCLFADDAGIFEKDILLQYIENRTSEDGSDLGMHLSKLFQVLNKDKAQRSANLDEDLQRFPYVNGGIFEENVEIPDFDSEMRQIFLEASYLDWSKISPAIFGSMFQSVMNPTERRNLGAHYTSEKNILKLIKPLFMDDLYEEFNKVKGNSNQLKQFHQKLSKLKFLDPACGCGNFLVITYRELRLLELEVLRELYKGQMATGIDQIIWLDVDQFYGIEYDEWPARIAEMALWLMDHQMNRVISEEFGEYFARLPLKKSAKIVHGNALRTDWEEVVPKSELSYIIGNPPFVGHQFRTTEQMDDMDLVFGRDSKSRRLDYVAAWFYKAAIFVQGSNILTGLVSTNSITQGEQVPILWKKLLVDLQITIHFAHRTFSWTNEAQGKAAVHVVIVGFGTIECRIKYLFDYPNINSEPIASKVANINGYLAPGDNLFIVSRGKPMHQFSPIYKGSQPTDGGFLVLSEEEKDFLIRVNPLIQNWIKSYLGGRELIQGIKRYCLWLKDCPPSELKKMPEVLERLSKVAEARAQSPTKSVQEFASMPSLFTQDRQPSSSYLAVPEVSSSARNHIPIGFLDSSVICSNQLQIIPKATNYLFGMMMSLMHNVWKENVCGRLKSDIRYSPAVYNNFPFPKDPSEKNKKKVEEKAQAVLDARAQFPDSSLADLYDPLTMPPALVKAHNELDKAVDLCYRPQPFISETARIEYLFDLYGEYTSPMFHEKKRKK
jgi:hypothetical protein